MDISPEEIEAAILKLLETNPAEAQKALDELGETIAPLPLEK